jgi:nitronate monooxygenase
MTELVGCSAPIQQAPMGPVATPELAAAVAGAGGLGTINGTGRTPEQLAATLDGLRQKTSGAIAANFLTSEMDRAAIEVAASRVRVVDFFWADPNPGVVELAHAGGALASWQVGSVAEAKAAVDAGCDMVVAQGAEAGGHVRGTVALLPLLDAVLDAVDVPVLASGGIGSARALAGVLAAGAAGARMGTRFLATEESGAHPFYKAAIVNAGIGETEITDAFSVMCPLCASVPRVRVLSSALAAARSFDGESVGEVDFGGVRRPIPRFAGLTPHAGVTGHIEAMVLFAGESVGAVTEIAPAARVVADLIDGAEKLLSAV